MLRSSLLVVASALCASSPAQMPVLAGQPWYLTGNPDLGELGGARQEPVDHAIFQSDDGRWHLWSCIRGTRVGRVLYAWEGTTLTEGPWQPVGIAMRADPDFGESVDDWGGQEWIQAPYVIRHAGAHHMLYGGHRSELGACQICLATSPDGRGFEKRRDGNGHSRVFVGPGEARDPMVVAHDGRFYCYYSGHDDGQRAPCTVYVRTSQDLVSWSEPTAVCWGGVAGAGNWSAECPFVVARDGAFYLFRTTDYRQPLTHVYRSDDPMDFGRGDDRRHIGTIAVAAPEVVVGANGEMFISSVHDLRGGIQLQQLEWVPDAAAPTSVAYFDALEPRWDFEDGSLQGWQAEGDAFAAQPTFADGPRLRGQQFAPHGAWFVGTYERRPRPEIAAGTTRGDAPTGELRSPDFELPDGAVGFRIGGGKDRQRLFVALCPTDDGRELHRATGPGHNGMQLVAWDVAEHAGARAFFRVVDKSSASWGHVNVDDFRVGR